MANITRQTLGLALPKLETELETPFSRFTSASEAAAAPRQEGEPPVNLSLGSSAKWWSTRQAWFPTRAPIQWKLELASSQALQRPFQLLRLSELRLPPQDGAMLAP